MAVLGLRFCVRAFSSCGKRGRLFIAVRRPLTIVASLVVEHRLQMRRLSNCGSQAQLLCGMWDPPRPGLEPVSPALAGRFSTTAPPGKPLIFTIIILNSFSGRLPISSSFAWSGGFLPCSFICCIFLCLFICLIYCVWGLLFVGCRFVVPVVFGVSLQWVRLVQWLV